MTLPHLLLGLMLFSFAASAWNFAQLFVSTHNDAGMRNMIHGKGNKMQDYAEPLIRLRSLSVEYEAAMQDCRYNAAVKFAHDIINHALDMHIAARMKQTPGATDPLTRKQRLDAIGAEELLTGDFADRCNQV